MADFQEFPKAIYHSKTKAVRIVKDAEEQSRLMSQGYSTQAPAQFDENGNVPDPSNMPDPNSDLTREPAIVSQIEQEKTRLAGNQGAKDPAVLLADEENGDENAEDLEPVPAPKPASKKSR